MNSISLAFIKKTTTHTLKHKHFSNCCLEPVSYAAAEEDSTSGLVIDVFDDLDKVGADVVLLHGCPQSCMQNPVEGLLSALLSQNECHSIPVQLPCILLPCLSEGRAICKK